MDLTNLVSTLLFKVRQMDRSENDEAETEAHIARGASCDLCHGSVNLRKIGTLR